MKKFKYIYRTVCFVLVVGVVLCMQNSSITTVTKAMNTNLNKNLNLNAMAKVIETFAYNDLNTVLDTYYGKLTGYVADCPLCTGYLYCTNQNVTDGTTTYIDNSYGTVRIVASSSKLPCGSIVRFENNTLSNDGYITAIVLDRGVTGTSLDLLVDSEETAITKVGSKKINYDVLRYGWTRENS